MKHNLEKKERLKNFLEYLITPQDETEAILFKENDCVDDYISIKSNLDNMTLEELIKEINIQLSPYKLELNET